MKRIIALGVGLICLIAGGGLLVWAGLPTRADFTSFTINDPAGVAQVVAPEVGAFPPPLNLPTLDGQTVDLRTLRGAPVVVNFWATWCAPCLIEMPELAAFYDTYHDSHGVQVVGVNLGEPPDRVQAWVSAMALDFIIALDADRRAEAQYQLRGQPTTVIITPQGRISHIFYGAITADTLHSALSPFLR